MPPIDLTALRHEFHRMPELGFAEESTKARVADILEDLGIETHIGAGVVGVLRRGTGNRAIGLRADMDALPIHDLELARPHLLQCDRLFQPCSSKKMTTAPSWNNIGI